MTSSAEQGGSTTSKVEQGGKATSSNEQRGRVTSKAEQGNRVEYKVEPGGIATSSLMENQVRNCLLLTSNKSCSYCLASLNKIFRNSIAFMFGSCVILQNESGDECNCRIAFNRGEE